MVVVEIYRETDASKESREYTVGYRRVARFSTRRGELSHPEGLVARGWSLSLRMRCFTEGFWTSRGWWRRVEGSGWILHRFLGSLLVKSSRRTYPGASWLFLLEFKKINETIWPGRALSNLKYRGRLYIVQLGRTCHVIIIILICVNDLYLH